VLLGDLKNVHLLNVTSVLAVYGSKSTIDARKECHLKAKGSYIQVIYAKFSARSD